MKIVIIGQNESKWIIPMHNFTLDFEKYWVLDRCTDDSESILKRLGEKNIIINKSSGEGRQTSFCRNMGYLFTREDSNVLFLDGDRYPVSGDLKSLENSKTDITLLKLEKDPRDETPVRFSEIYGTIFNNFFSCGIFFKKDALKKIKDFYKTRRDDYGESIIFPESVQQYWGIEDTHLGDICYHLGLSCEVCENIRLHGSFDKNKVSGLNTIESRFTLRDKLNVLW